MLHVHAPAAGGHSCPVLMATFFFHKLESTVEGMLSSSKSYESHTSAKEL